MKVESKKVPINCSGMSLIGTGDERPVSWGNYFSMKVDGHEVRVMNMWWENLQHAGQAYIKGNKVQVRLYTHVYEDGDERRWCLIDDKRIPDDYYYNKLCFTGSGGGMPKEVAKDMYEHVGDPENEFEQFTDPVSYHAKRGGKYDPKTGIVCYHMGTESKGGIIIPTTSK